MMRTTEFMAAFSLAGIVAVVPSYATGQEFSRVPGRTLPQAYYQRVYEKPDLFELQHGWIQSAQRAEAMNTAVSGTLPLVVIPALFADSEDPHISHEQMQAVLFDGPSDYGTLNEFYEEVSSGRLSVVGQVAPWTRTSLTMSEVVAGSYGLGDGARTGEYLIEALDSADAIIDFGLFDNDGPDGSPNSGDDDGRVDAVAFQFLEIAASCGGPSIWPHRSRIDGWTSDGSPYTTNDSQPDGQPILVSDYIVQGATDCGGVEAQTATTIAHELGHVLGITDLYDRSRGVEPEHRHWVVGCWSLMAAGAWGCGASDREEWVRPTHMGAWEKIQLGWLSELEEAPPALLHQYTLDPVLSSQQALKIPLESGDQADTNEYLLVEYRVKDGFDQDLPASGVLVYHVDPTKTHNQLLWSEPQWYMVSLLEADGNSSLQRSFQEGGNRGEAGDAWGVAGTGRISNSTIPSTRLNSGDESPVTIHDISIVGGEAHITVSTAVVADASLVHAFLGSNVTPLTTEEEEYLDAYGNNNGQYDVGDLRAYLRR
ncbi:M6 family metalloprotease domain-containing protein [Gemmatimonadota bacterium]